jgi:hypothetical protein
VLENQSKRVRLDLTPLFFFSRYFLLPDLTLFSISFFLYAYYFHSSFFFRGLDSSQCLCCGMGVEAPRRPNRKIPLSPSETSPEHVVRRLSLRSIPLHTPWATSTSPIALLPPASLCSLLLGQSSRLSSRQVPRPPRLFSAVSVRLRKRRLPAATSLPTTYHRWRRKTVSLNLSKTNFREYCSTSCSQLLTLPLHSRCTTRPPLPSEAISDLNLGVGSSFPPFAAII